MTEIATGKPVDAGMMGGGVELAGGSPLMKALAADILPKGTAISVVPTAFEGLKAGDPLPQVLGPETPSLHGKPGALADVVTKMTGAKMSSPEIIKSQPVAPKL